MRSRRMPTRSAWAANFTAVNEKRKTQVTDAALFPAPIRRLHELLASDAFVQRMSFISGIPDLVADPMLVGGGIHETNHGGHLDVHVDFNVNERTGLFRRLNILVYFNRDWKEEYGGVLDLWDEDVRHCLGRFAPIFNRAAGFATSATSWHGVTPVTCPPTGCAARSRRTTTPASRRPAGTASGDRPCFVPARTSTGRARSRCRWRTWCRRCAAVSPH